jgi:uncharacterized protein YndB with AHSA1/START domain
MAKVLSDMAWSQTDHNRNRKELTITRIFDAPRERVWKAWTGPERFMRWWGPRNLTTTVDRMDVRPGGAWRFVQRDSEGNEYAFHGVHHEIAPPERLVYTFEFEGMPGHVLLGTATLEEIDDMTKLTDRSVYQAA